MKKVFIALTLVLSLVLFFSCNKGKIAEYENTIENLNSQIALLQEENEAFKQTDQYYYQSGADAFLNENDWDALVWMGKLKVKFPTSPLLLYANKIIEDAKLQIDKSNKRLQSLHASDGDRNVILYYIPGIGDIPRKIDLGEFKVPDPSRFSKPSGDGIIMPGNNDEN